MAGRGINKVILVGYLGADPEVRYTQNGDPIANLRVATSEAWTDKLTGQTNERTEWHRVVLFGRLADVARQYLSKGRQVYIEGSLRTRKWQDREGRDQYTTEVVCNDLQMLGGRKEEANRAEAGTTRSVKPSPAPTAPSQDVPTSKDASGDLWGSPGWMDEDIPF